MPYVPNSNDATEPVGSVIASTAAAEFRGIKNRLNTSSYDPTYANAVAAPNAPTCNSISGRVAISSGNLNCTVTNSFCQVTSVVLTQLESADTTMTRVTVQALAGVFIITGNAACTADVVIAFVVHNSIPASP